MRKKTKSKQSAKLRCNSYDVLETNDMGITQEVSRELHKPIFKQSSPYG